MELKKPIYDDLKAILKNRKQFIAYHNFLTSFIYISCGVSQDSILGLLLFLVYANNLDKAPDVLDSIMFADDTNLFFEW